MEHTPNPMMGSLSDMADEKRTKIRDYIGVQDLSPKTDYEIMEEQAMEGYRRYLIHYTGSENDTVPAYLLVPDGEGPFPAVLVHHQHNGERHLGKSEICGLVGSPLQAFGPALAAKGFVVLAPDSICFEDRRKNAFGTMEDEKDFIQHFNEMCYRILKGGNLMTKVLDDANIGLSLLKSLNKVDKKRIGTLGHSYGGNTVVFQAALSEDIRYACASGASCTYEKRMQDGTGIEMASVIPGFYNHYDIPDLIACIAPRNLLVVSADADKYAADANDIVAKAQPAYAALGAADRLEHKRYEGGHALTEERFQYIINWLVKTANNLIISNQGEHNAY